MEIITRASAMAANLNRYFTGKPCVNGHVDYRYTTSGACKSCLAENNGKIIVKETPELIAARVAVEQAAAALTKAKERYAELARVSRKVKVDKQNERLVAHQARSNALSQLTAEARNRVHNDELENVRVSIWALTALRLPEVTLEDIVPKITPRSRDGYMAHYTFRCHPEDLGAVNGLLAEALRRRSLNIEEAAARAREAAARYIPPPEPLPDSYN